MPNYDVFNGDADGICSLIQLRLAQPREANLVTGVKRDIKLLNSLKAEAGDHITVLDVSMDKNQTGLHAVLHAGANVFYADHHQSGEIPDHPALEAHINTAANTCTGLIIDYYLKGQYREWAIVAAYGDNINHVADEYATHAELTDDQRSQLRALGVAMNYNGYGASEEDLFYHPAELYKLAAPYQSPFDFIKERADVYKTLTEGYATDLEKGLNITPVRSSDNAAMIMLPNEQWARRISGVLGNELASRYLDRAHAILTEREEQIDGPDSKKEKTYLVSIRAAKNNLVGADTIAVKFGGGGRKGAAGIDRLLETEIDTLWAEFL
jgi:hypothetical protein